ncbi:hypothetical protein [Clostridium sp. UBA6640]|uniref:hypothetical protein n=1 Tax=Clostridium sp. UBA6640 TaxID=1946370 RepID=UPI0025C13C97|nr:hypothetical protein [Clostridium sp. UBA6640]
MFYIECDKNRNKLVTLMHAEPFDEEHGRHKSEEELRKTGILIEDIPKAYPPNKGMIWDLFYNEEDKTFLYEYFFLDEAEEIEEKPENKEDEITLLKQELLEVQQYIINKEEKELL